MTFVAPHFVAGPTSTWQRANWRRWSCRIARRTWCGQELRTVIMQFGNGACARDVFNSRLCRKYNCSCPM